MFSSIKKISNVKMSTYGKRPHPDATAQDGTTSAESLVNQEAIASLIKRVGDLEKKGKFLLVGIKCRAKRAI